MRRTDQHISAGVHHVGKTGILIKRYGEAVHNLSHFVRFQKVSLRSILQDHFYIQVKFIDARAAADVRIDDPLFLRS